jgi:hypothetical protein
MAPLLEWHFHNGHLKKVHSLRRARAVNTPNARATLVVVLIKKTINLPSQYKKEAIGLVGQRRVEPFTLRDPGTRVIEIGA